MIENETLQKQLDDMKNWIMIGPDRAILRFPLQCSQATLEQIVATGTYRQADFVEFRVATLCAPYVWGHSPNPDFASRMWREKGIGIGGLDHSVGWFVTAQGRAGGAWNVNLEPGPNSNVRCGTDRFMTAFPSSPGSNEVNEGYCLVWKNPPGLIVYRQMQEYAARHIGADAGVLLVSPAGDDEIYVGFGGKCMTCCRLEGTSFPQLQQEFPDLNLNLHPDWCEWEVDFMEQAVDVLA